MRARIEILLMAREILVVYERKENRLRFLVYISKYGIRRKIRNEFG
jgi:hypothetical protein